MNIDQLMSSKPCSSCKVSPASIRTLCHPCKSLQSKKARKNKHDFKIYLPVSEDWIKRSKESEARILKRFTK